MDKIGKYIFISSGFKYNKTKKFVKIRVAHVNIIPKF